MTSHDDYASILNAFGELEFSSHEEEGISEDEVKQIKEHYEALKEKGEKAGMYSGEYYESRILTGDIWGVTIPTDLSDLRNPREMKMAHACRCRMAKYPFAIGGLRAAYHAKVQIEGSDDWTDMVVKEFMLDQDRKEKAYHSQSENSAMAYFLCEKYYELGGSSSKRIRAVRSRILKLRTGTGSWKYLNMEEKLLGTFKKWTNNFGGIPERNRDIVKFAKWTHEVSDGYLLVSDIQGVENATQIFLTDPAVICTDDKRFGPTNFQPKAQMTACLTALKGTPHSRLSGLAGTTVRRPGFSPLSDHTVRDSLLLKRLPKLFAPKLIASKPYTPAILTSSATGYYCFASDNINDMFGKRNDISCVAMGSSFAVFLYSDGSFSWSSGTPVHLSNFLKSRSDPCDYASVSPSGQYYYFRYRNGSSWSNVPENCRKFVHRTPDVQIVALGDNGKYFASSKTEYQASDTRGAYKAISETNKPFKFVSVSGHDHYFIMYQDGSSAWSLPKHISNALKEIAALGGELKNLYFCQAFGEDAFFCLAYSGISTIPASVTSKLKAGSRPPKAMLLAPNNFKEIFMEISGIRCVALGGSFGVFIKKDGSLAWSSGIPLHLANTLKDNDGSCIYGAVNKTGNSYYFKYADGSACYSVPENCSAFMESKTGIRFVTFGENEGDYFALAEDGSSQGIGCDTLFAQIKENSSRGIQFVSIGGNNNYFVVYKDGSSIWSLNEKLANILNETMKKGYSIPKVFISGDVENYCFFYSEAP
jgi:hypothetical protein